MKTLRRILTGTALAVMSAGLAGAVTTGYTAITPTGAGTGGSGYDNTDFSYSLTLPKFDSSLGNLTGVRLYYFAAVHTTALNLTNNGGSPANFDLDVNSRVNFGGLINSANSLNNYSQETLTQLSIVGITLGDGTKPNCAFATPDANCSSVDYAPPTIVNDNSGFGSLSGVGDGSRTVTGVEKIVGAGQIASYIGAGGTFTLSSATKAQLGLSGGGGNLIVTQATKARFEVEVDYTYTPTVTSATPEPTTMILFGSALVGLGFMRRKK